MKTFRPCLAEFLGTFYLCFAGIGAILCNTPAVGGAPGLLGIAPAHGLALSIALNGFGGESGAHFNPAVPSGFLLTGRIAPPLPPPPVAPPLAGPRSAAAGGRAGRDAAVRGGLAGRAGLASRAGPASRGGRRGNTCPARPTCPIRPA